MRRLATAHAFLGRLTELGIELPFDAELEPNGPLAQPVGAVGNRFAVLPMEGWDGTDDGRPTDLVRRRWRRFGESGAKLIWGGEAVAVVPEGRANPHQLVISEELGELREELVGAHQSRHGSASDLVVGLQLTHSGRFSHGGGVAAYRHPVLDERWPAPVVSDAELDDLVGVFIDAAGIAGRCGFEFVDIKCCHGYLGHELLSGVDRPGPYGGDLVGRTKFVRTVVGGIREALPDLKVGIRLSVFDVVPHRPGGEGAGEPEIAGPYAHAFGGDGSGLGIDLSEPVTLLGELVALGVGLICTTAGSPYYCPHVQRPAFFPPSDGYSPPEDPLVGVARLVRATADIRAAVQTTAPDVLVVGSGYSYLQEWLPNVAQAAVRAEWVDVVGLGRMVLSYPDLPADVLGARRLERRRICRTFSDCTTAPRNGLVSGCWPLDPFYKSRPDRAVLAAAKRAAGRADDS